MLFWVYPEPLPAHGRGGLVTFVLAKVTKTAPIRNASLPHRAFALQIGQILGCNLFAGLPYRFNTTQAKICYALPRSWPPLFCPISPEAYLLGKKRISASSVSR
jgi:hypothetical protein